MKSPIHNFLALASIIIAQFLFGKKAAFPLGLVLGYSAYNVALIVIICDLSLMFLVYEIFSVSVAKFRWAQYTRNRFEHLQGWLREGRWTSKLIPVGWAGVVVVTAIPFAGGVWTGVALSRAIAMSRKASLWAVGLGSIIGCGIFLFAALGVMHLASITAEPVLSN